jgi:hypothetical protein
MVMRSPSISEAINALIERIGQDLNVSLPGTIEDYDHENQLASVKPSLKRPLRSEDGEDVEAESLPVIPNVPVVQPSGGGYFVHFPLKKGDPVTLIISDRSLDRWKERGGEVDPGFTHTHELTDALAFPGGRSKPDALTGTHADHLVIGHEDDASRRIVIDGSLIKLSENATNFVALANLVKSEIQALRNWAAGHTHTSMDTFVGSGTLTTNPTSSPIGPPPTVNDVAASKVKAE